MKIGKRSVGMGNLPPGTTIGDDSVMIGATDSNGNTILNTTMAVGANAHAGEGSIAIGYNAGAGGGLISLLSALQQQSADADVSSAAAIIITELRSTAPNANVIRSTWETIRTAATLNSVYSLVERISPLIDNLFS